MTTSAAQIPTAGNRLLVPDENGQETTWCVLWAGALEEQTYLILRLEDASGMRYGTHVCHWRVDDGMYSVPEDDPRTGRIMALFRVDCQKLADATIARLEAGESFFTTALSSLHLMLEWADETPPTYLRVVCIVENVGAFLRDYVILMPVDAFNSSLTPEDDSVVFECKIDDEGFDLGEVVADPDLERQICKLAMTLFSQSKTGTDN